MPLNRSDVRTDIPYLRRRVKPAPPVTAADTAATNPAPPPSSSKSRTYTIPLANDPAARKPPKREPQPQPGPAVPDAAPSQPALPEPGPRATPSAGLSLSSPSPQPSPAQPGPPPATSTAAPRASSGAGLSLSPSAAASTSTSPSSSPFAASTSSSTSSAASSSAAAPKRPAPPAGSLPFAAPTIDEVRELDEDEPVVRLNARESAIGSLIVTGANFAVWEDPERVTGSVTASGGRAGSPVTTSGNRPLIGFDDSDAIVALRHVSQLRRALFIGRGPEPFGVQIFDGATMTVAPGDTSRMFVLYMMRINNLLELRAEPVDRSATDDSIMKQFGFTLTPYLPPRETRSR